MRSGFLLAVTFIDFLPQLGEAFQTEPAGEFVIELGQDLFLDLLQDDPEYRRLPGKLLVAVILRESHGDLPLLLSLHTRQLRLEAGDKGAGAEFQDVPFGFAAGKRLSCNLPLEVDDDKIAFLRLIPTADLQFGSRLAQFFDPPPPLRHRGRISLSPGSSRHNP